jgi:hypothetical protein
MHLAGTGLFRKKFELSARGKGAGLVDLTG